MSDFTEKSPTLDNYWRSIILFGQNVASYKFALAKSLLEFRDRGSDLVTLEELAKPFSQNICEHLQQSPKQATSRSSKFLNACRSHNEGTLSQTDLVTMTTKLGFKNVIDAFHVVNQGKIPRQFFIDERKESSGIRLTDDLFYLFENQQSYSLNQEVEARWRLVETAWDLNVSRNLIAIDYDVNSQILFTQKNTRRVNVTSCKDALNGYQKGRCFYCFDYISVENGNASLADVDHFFPHTLKKIGVVGSLNGVWNLVLSCKECNRGEAGKFARLPTPNLLSRLKCRNDYLINSHHPLRETLITQTGVTEDARRSFLQSTYDEALKVLIHTWQPPIKYDPQF